MVRPGKLIGFVILAVLMAIGKRVVPAAALMMVVRGVIGTIGTIAFMLVFGSVGAGGLGFGSAMIIWFVLSWFYFGLFEALWNGQTPGKRLMGIRVVSIEGQPITPFQAILRNILRVADAQPAGLYLVGLVAATLSDRFQRLGDLPSGTLVVIEERRYLRGVVRINEPEAIRAAASIPPTFQSSRSLGRVLAAYVQRRQLFPWGRRIEIARHIGEPLRQKFQLPPGTDLDMLLCGLYRRAFIADRTEEPQSASPFKRSTRSADEFARATVADGLLPPSESKEERTNHGDTESTEGIEITERVVMSPPPIWERGNG